MYNRILPVLFALALFSCKRDDPSGSATYQNGVFVLNEGLYQSGNASVSFFRPEASGLDENIFEARNGVPLGDVLQSATLIHDRLYLVVNNSAKIEVVNARDFSRVATISGFSSPRYMLQVSETQAYVSDWISDRVKIIDLRTNQITGSIPVGVGPEQMCMHEGKVYVCNSGGYGIDSSLSVIDPQTGFVVDRFATPAGPVAIGTDANSRLWVLCRGDYKDYANLNDDIAGRLIRLDLQERSLDREFVFSPWNHPMKMAFSPDRQTIWYLNEGLYKMSISQLSAPTVPVSAKYFYGIAVDPASGMVYCADPVDYVQKGFAFRYLPDGSLVDSFKVEYVPSGFVFY